MIFQRQYTMLGIPWLRVAPIIRALSLIGLGSSLGCSPGNTQIVADVEFPTDIDQFVNDTETTKVIGRVQLTNHASDLREITKIVASCNCSSMTPNPPLKIEPNSSATITYEIDFPIRDRSRNVSFSYFLKDGAVAKSNVFLSRGDVFSITPPAHNLGTIIEGAKAVTIMTIVASNQSDANVAIEAAPQVRTRKLADGRFEVVMDSAGFPLGPFSTDVRFRSPRGTYRDFTLTGVIKPLYGLVLDDVESKASTFALTIIRADNEPVPAIKLIRGPSTGQVTLLEQVEKGNYLRCHFRVDTPREFVKSGKEIVVKFEDGFERKYSAH